MPKRPLAGRKERLFVCCSAAESSSSCSSSAQAPTSGLLDARRWLVRMVRGDGGSASSTLLVRVGVELVQKAEALLGFDLVGFAMRFVWSLLFSTIVGQTWRSS